MTEKTKERLWAIWTVVFFIAFVAALFLIEIPNEMFYLNGPGQSPPSSW